MPTPMRSAAGIQQQLYQERPGLFFSPNLLLGRGVSSRSRSSGSRPLTRWERIKMGVSGFRGVGTTMAVIVVSLVAASVAVRFFTHQDARFLLVKRLVGCSSRVMRHVGATEAAQMNFSLADNKHSGATRSVTLRVSGPSASCLVNAQFDNSELPKAPTNEELLATLIRVEVLTPKVESGDLGYGFTLIAPKDIVERNDAMERNRRRFKFPPQPPVDKK
ncbi:MAG: hypothetical protein Q8P67_00040 [archaeon]|nr:hypothetical protein [archaeon]